VPSYRILLRRCRAVSVHLLEDGTLKVPTPQTLSALIYSSVAEIWGSLLCEDTGLLFGDIGLFYKGVQLFRGDVRLFFGKAGLFCGRQGSFVET